jgi:UDP-glucose:tetrahydrobiopterin glucosyltransferase
VELTLANLITALKQRGHSIDVVAPKGSVLPHHPVIQIDGTLQDMAQTLTRSAAIALPLNSVLANMWEYARQVELAYDLVVNFAYDWLPFYLTPWFRRPVAHLVSMGSLTDAMDGAIAQVIQRFPGTIAVHTQAQANTFAFGDQCRCLGNGFNLSQYHFGANPENVLGWVGRIAPEKGLEDAIAAAQRSQIPLKIWGKVSDPDYWQQVQQHWGDEIHYEGFVPTQVLQHQLGQCRGLLVTPRWIEAFGNVVIEALACGVPVIAYRRGGPAELVREGETGWLVEPDSVDGLVEAIARLDQIDRPTCRAAAERDYSLTAMGDRTEQWFYDIIKNRNLHGELSPATN